jgi:hypothetical protein
MERSLWPVAKGAISGKNDHRLVREVYIHVGEDICLGGEPGSL